MNTPKIIKIQRFLKKIKRFSQYPSHYQFYRINLLTSKIENYLYEIRGIKFKGKFKPVSGDPNLDAHATFYMPSAGFVIKDLIKNSLLLARNLEVFIDVGCGMGKPSIYASQFSYKEIIGFDYSPHLIQIANANKKNWV